VLIPPDSGGRKEPRPGWTGGRYSWMRTVLGSHGKLLYRKRIQMIEPVFAHTKHNRTITQLPPMLSVLHRDADANKALLELTLAGSRVGDEVRAADRQRTSSPGADSQCGRKRVEDCPPLAGEERR
jgi:hypothetical protein